MRRSPTCRIVVHSGDILEAEHANSRSNDRYTALWTGLIYADDGSSDEMLVDRLLRDLLKGTPIEAAAAQLRGSFFLAVRDHRASTVYVLVDDSGLYTAYRSGNGASTSFLSLCRAEGIRSNALNRSAIIELLHLGNVYFGDTLSPAVHKIASNEVVVSSTDGVRVIQKPIAKLCDPPKHESFLDAIAPLTTALRGKSVSVDLTGGFDSRMLACALVHHGVPFETAMSGHAMNADAVIGQKVAEALGRPYFFSEYRGEGLLEDLEDTLEHLDGMGGLLLVNHRLRRLNEDRIARGASIALKGNGGELYKDFFWTQDFPFYSSPNTRMDRLSRLRLEFELFTPSLLTDEGYQEFCELRESRRRRLSDLYTMPINTQSYDMVYFFERVQIWNSRTASSTQSSELAVHIPLGELHLAQLGFHAPRSKRFYNRFQREIISRVSPRAARVTTTDGTSASASTLAMVPDAFGYAQGKLKKLAKRTSQVVFNQARSVPVSYSRDLQLQLLSKITSSETGQHALQTLKDANIIRGAVTFEDISPRFREHLVVTGWTLNRLGS